MKQLAVYLSIFWCMQIIAQLFFKWGSTSESYWWWGFLLGNLFGFSSIWLLMLMYKTIHPNVALGIGMGGAFLLTQIVLALVFKTQVAVTQWIGIIAMAGGMFALAAGRF